MVPTVDMGKYLPFHGVFEPLKDPAYFAQVRVDEDAGTIVWPNGADLDPCELHERVTGVPSDEAVDEPDCATLPRLLAEWGRRHQAELLENWSLARARKPLKRIAPLE